MSETFDLSDLKLNLESNPPTSWGNLGYWTTKNQTYAAAASALAKLHADAAKLGPNTRLLDLAFGCGDQLQLWQQAYRPADITAVNISTSQTARAKEHFSSTATLHRADAVEFLRSQASTSFDAIMAVDSAYHFSPWSDFLDEVTRVLAPGGRLVITTLAAQRGGTLKARWLSQSLRVAGISMPSLNLEQTLRHLRAKGLDTEATNITSSVFAGFANWWAGYKQEYAASWKPSERWRYDITSYWLEQALQTGSHQYLLLVACK